MCIYYVELLCAVRFGLFWTHDVFKFSCHMHTYLCLSLFWYLSMLVLFCVFLSLSFFLSVSCSIAPKQKSTPSQNPLRSGASSSLFDSTPSHIRFRDDKAHKDFSKNFSRQGIHSERQVVLSNFSNTDLLTVIYNQGWESLCGILVTCPSVIIQEFYSTWTDSILQYLNLSLTFEVRAL